jgi:hypothetical protein
MRSSESIESQLTFLKLFGSGILDVLPGDCFLNKVAIFRSGPGGGKTSLFRLFSPDSLQEIFQHPLDYKDLSQSLEQYEIINENGPTLLGVYLRLSDYGSFQDLKSSDEQKSQYLFSLIGYRLILKTLLGVLTLKNLTINDLERITINKPIDVTLPKLSLPCTGKLLYDWASDMEQNICNIINRFDISPNNQFQLLLNLDHIKILNPENILFDGKPVITKMLVMLDDIHELRKPQRKLLLEKITPARYPASIWLAERLEALDLPDLVPGIPGREYNEIFLEEFWESKNKSFETFVRSISTKRAEMAKLDFEMNSLHQHLEDSIDTPNWSSKFKNISDDIQNKLHTVSFRTSTYDKWIIEQERKIQSPLDNSIDWRVLEIKIAREEKNAQKKLFDVPMDAELDDADSGLKATAEFFLHHEYDIPYFFNFSKIAKLATFNVEQFLEIASSLFDEIVSQRIKNKKNDILSSEKQEKIIKNVAKLHWEQIRKKIYNGRDLVIFLTKFKDFAIEQTLQPNAPYVPGVTGIGISKKYYDKIIDLDVQEKNKNYKRLAEILQSCISHNFLKVKYEAKQGKEGNEVTILYLNRLLCAHFDLPLGKGGWRHKTLDELCDWLGLESLEIDKKVKS